MSAIERALPYARVLFTTRAGGVSQARYESLNLGAASGDDPERVARNRQLVADRVGVPVAYGRQVHGTDVEVWTDLPGAGAEPQADAHVTRRDDLALGVLAADCLPVALSSESGVAIVHAGWRGIVGGVLEAAIDRLRGLGGAETLHAAIGPGAGPCCYSVAGETAELLGRHVVDGRADLKAAAGARIAAAGADSITDVGLCTICDERFFSHRRSGGDTGRQAGIVWRV